MGAIYGNAVGFAGSSRTRAAVADGWAVVWKVEMGGPIVERGTRRIWLEGKAKKVVIEWDFFGMIYYIFVSDIVVMGITSHCSTP